MMRIINVLSVISFIAFAPFFVECRTCTDDESCVDYDLCLDESAIKISNLCGIDGNTVRSKTIKSTK